MSGRLASLLLYCIALLLSTWASSSASEADAPEAQAARDAAYGLDVTASLGQPSCSGNAPGAEREFRSHFVSATGTVPSFWQGLSCDDLLSGTPPAWFTAALGEEVKNSEWWPVCSLSRVFLFYSPKLELKKSWEMAYDALKRQDLCRHEKLMRGGDGYVPPTQVEKNFSDGGSPNQTSPKQAIAGAAAGPERHKEVSRKIEGPHVLTGKARDEYLNQINAVKTAMQKQCCAGSQQCEGIFQNTPLEFCKPQTDPNKPDPCIEGSAFDQPYHLIIPAPAKITLNPLVDLDGQPADSISVVAHELGHSCSSARRFVGLANAKTADAILEYLGLRGNPCAITAEQLDFYKELFASVGVNAESVSCLIDLAKRGSRQRFGDGPCPKACPVENLEEDFAKLMAFKFTSDDERVAHSILGSFCGGRRDTTHALGPDSLRCFMKTPGFKAKVRSLLKCR